MTPGYRTARTAVGNLTTRNRQSTRQRLLIRWLASEWYPVRLLAAFYPLTRSLQILSRRDHKVSLIDAIQYYNIKYSNTVRDLTFSFKDATLTWMLLNNVFASASAHLPQVESLTWLVGTNLLSTPQYFRDIATERTKRQSRKQTMRMRHMHMHNVSGTYLSGGGIEIKWKKIKKTVLFFIYSSYIRPKWYINQ